MRHNVQNNQEKQAKMLILLTHTVSIVHRLFQLKLGERPGYVKPSTVLLAKLTPVTELVV